MTRAKSGPVPPRAFPLVFLMAPLERTVLGFLVISPFFLYTRQAILTPNFHSEGPVMPSLVSPYHTNYGRGLEIRIQQSPWRAGTRSVRCSTFAPPPAGCILRASVCEDGALSVHSCPGVFSAEVDPSAFACVLCLGWDSSPAYGNRP